MSFWKTLPKPIIGLSPMDGITDMPFREIVAKVSKPSVIFTEFVNAKGLFLGNIKLYNHLLFSTRERPIIGQLFGAEPEYFYKAAHILCELGFDGIDINMGCPANTVVNKNGGASLIKQPKLALEIIKQTKLGVRDWYNGQSLENLDLDKEKIAWIQEHKQDKDRQIVPVSVKTRLGYNKNTIDSWIITLLKAKPEAIIVHGRTFSQLYHGTANWEAIGSIAAKVRSVGITYLGNGDITSKDEAIQKIQTYQLDGVLIGRAACGNPWIFSDYKPTIKKRLQVALEHIKCNRAIKGSTGVNELKKHLSWYCKGFDQAKTLRTNLMEVKQYSDFISLLENAIITYSL